MKKDLISVKELTAKDIKDIFDLTDRLKKNKLGFRHVLSGKTLALIFQKPSNRTRVSFEVGMYQLGGYSLYLGPDQINLGVRESVKDVAKTLSRYVDAIVLRTFEHRNVLEMAQYSDKPVINGLSDSSHPCQALTDVYTVKEKLKDLKGRTLVYVGDGNNVCNSLLCTCARVGLSMKVASPSGYEPQDSLFKEAKRWGKATGAAFELFHEPKVAVRVADIIYTDLWVRKVQEKEAASRKKAFRSFQVNKDLVRLAKPHVLIMHCLPAHRGQEITDEVLDGKNSVVFDQAENRMHVQKAILMILLGKG